MSVNNRVKLVGMNSLRSHHRFLYTKVDERELRETDFAYHQPPPISAVFRCQEKEFRNGRRSDPAQ